MAVATQQHRFVEMSYKEVDILGMDDDGHPVAVVKDDIHVGICCLNCATPYVEGAETQECNGIYNDE